MHLLVPYGDIAAAVWAVRVGEFIEHRRPDFGAVKKLLLAACVAYVHKVPRVRGLAFAESRLKLLIQCCAGEYCLELGYFFRSERAFPAFKVVLYAYILNIARQ